MTEYLTVSQAAEKWGVQSSTVRNWIHSGQLKARRTAGGHFRIAREDFNLIRASDLKWTHTKTERNKDMTKYYEFSPQVWTYLTDLAAEGETRTYKQAAFELGLGGAYRKLGDYLDPAFYFCKSNGLPLLTVLIVRSDTGKPGGEDFPDPETETLKVLGHDWAKMPVPSVSDFEATN